jgi:hypothetical protein
MFCALSNVGLGILFDFFFLIKRHNKNHSFSFKSTLSTQSELVENKLATLKHTRNEKRIFKSHSEDNTVFGYSQLVLLASKLHSKRGSLINYDL